MHERREHDEQARCVLIVTAGTKQITSRAIHRATFAKRSATSFHRRKRGFKVVFGLCCQRDFAWFQRAINDFHREVFFQRRSPDPGRQIDFEDPEHADVYLDGGLRAPQKFFRQHTIIKGDGKIPVISCASVLAKVYRDALMNEYDLKFPQYGFFNNKGYGTPEHYKAIRKHGIISIHRKLFLKGIA